MSGETGTRFGWPWGPNSPTPRRRATVATLVAAIAAATIVAESQSGNRTDFAQLWFSAREMLAGGDPYALIGPGRAFSWDWPLFYPATSFALVAPVSWLSEAGASTVFVAVSVWLLVFGATRDSWHRLPAFASSAFVIAVRAAQWSPIMTAGWFWSPAAASWAAKPTLGLAMLLAVPAKRPRVWALIGGAVLLAISLSLLPTWPESWLNNLRATSHMRSPIQQPGGLLIALCLLRWRSREAMVLLVFAMVPQSPSIYEALPILLLIPATYKEAACLSIISSIGALLMLRVPQGTTEEFIRWRGALLVVTTYLPGVALVLRRPRMNDRGISVSSY